MENGSSKPFLRKGEGISGRYMKLISYPVIKRTLPKNTIQSPAFNFGHGNFSKSECNSVPSRSTSFSKSWDKELSCSSGFEAQGTLSSPSKKLDDIDARPVTSGTVDSGCPEDEVIVSPDPTSRANSIQTIACDVSDVSTQQTVSENVFLPYFSEETFCSIIPDGATSLPSVSHRVNSSVVNSTAEFERVEAEINAAMKSDVYLSDSDGGSTKVWREKIANYRKSAVSDKECQSEYSSLSISSSISTLLPNLVNHSIRTRADDAGFLDKIQQNNFHRRLQKLLDVDDKGVHRKPLRESFPGLIEERTNTVDSSTSNFLSKTSGEVEPNSGSEVASVNLVSASCTEQLQKGRHLRHAYSSSLLEKSSVGSPGGHLAREILNAPTLFSERPFFIPNSQVSETSRKPSSSSNNLSPSVQTLAKQLRDLLVYLDVVAEENRRRNTELQSAYSKLLQDHACLLGERNELTVNVHKLEEEGRRRLEESNSLQKSEQLKNAEINRLKKELSVLKKQQKISEDGETELVKVLKQQGEDLRRQIREFERQLIDIKSQKRRVESTLKDKDKQIEELKEEKEKLSTRLKAITDQKAETRGKNAGEMLSHQAWKQAVTKAPVTASSKKISLLGASRGRKASINNKAIETLDNGGAAYAQFGAFPNGMQKTVHWNEPLATAVNSFSQNTPPSDESCENTREKNFDMRVIQTEENEDGKATLYRSPLGDFAVHTLTLCGCSFYEYSNKDIRWIHSSGQYQVNYYGQSGATTVEFADDTVLIRHFLTGQLEIYRKSGEITFVAPNGNRIETIRISGENSSREDGFRIEMYENNRKVRVIYKDGHETQSVAGLSSCFRSDGSYVQYVPTDESVEFRAENCAVRRFKNGDVKVRLSKIDTSISILMIDVGTVKHLVKPAGCTQKYCAEWGKVSRERSRRFGIMSRQYDCVNV